MINTDDKIEVMNNENHEYQPFSIHPPTISTQTRKQMQKYSDIWRFTVE